MKFFASKLKKRLVVGLASLAVVCTGAAAIAVQAEGTDDPVWNTGFDFGKTAINSVLAIDAGTADYRGASYDLTAKVVYPDGRATTNEKFITDVCGEYKVQYSFQADDRTFTKDESFLVYQDGESLFTGVNCNVEANASSPSYMTKSYTGLKINPTKTGAKINYNSLVNLNDNNKSEALFSFIFTPQKPGVEEMNQILVTFTDAFDPTNYVTWDIRSGSWIAWPQFTHVSVFASNQSYYTIGGSQLAHNVTAAGYSANYTDEDAYLALELYYDADSKQAYGYPHQFGGFSNINDLDDSEFAECANPWKGIPSGLAYVSMEFRGLTSSEASILLLSLDGQNYASEEIATDTERVSIGIDYMGYDPDGLPKGLVDNAYPVFESIASSTLCGKIGVDGVTVYAPDGGTVVVKDGKFVPKQAGKYYVVYTATSPYGHTAKKVVTIRVTDGYEEAMRYEWNEKLLSESNVFDRYYTYEGKATGGEGRITSEWKVLDPSGNQITLITGDGTPHFIPQTTGKYKIVATIKDFLGNEVTDTKEIEVVAKKDVFLEEAVVPNVLRVGKAFTFPEISAYKYTATGIETSETTLKINGVAQTSHTYKVEQEGTITVTYESQGITNDYVVECREITAKKGFLADYFYAENGTLAFEAVDESEDSDYEFVFTATASESSWEFINPINTDDLSLTFGFKEGFAAFDEVDVYIVDAKNSQNAIQITLVREGERFYLTANGERVKEVNDPTVVNFGFSVSKSDFGLYDASKVLICPISKKTDGEPFKGFEGDSVFMTTTVKGVAESGVKMTIAKVSRQTITNGKYDITAPVLVMPNEASVRNALLGETITFGAAYGFDVLDLNETKTTLKLTAPNEKVIYEGTIESDYQVKLDMLGTYRAEYSTSDQSGNSTKFVRTVNVIENDPPKIKLKGSYKKTAKVNAVTKLAEASVSDKSETKVYYLIIDESGNIFSTSENKYVFTKAGKYTVRVLACDAYSNQATMEYTITVK